jgi:hypothetical protein
MAATSGGGNAGSIDWDELEAELDAIVRRDPAGRGLASYRGASAPRGLGYGALRGAAEDLAQRGERVAIVTGFCIVDAIPPAAETDGPPGALYLARALAACGIGVVLISDAYGAPLLRAGIDEMRLAATDVEIIVWPGVLQGPPGRTLESPRTLAQREQFAADFLASQRIRGLTHVIATERVGPSHTPSSMAAEDEATRAMFLAETSADERGACHNMRGMNIDGFTAPTHDLFDFIAARRLPIVTIGIGDGGNEIGMGSFSWSELREAVRTGPAATIACRVAVDHAIVAGVSDWGAYGLALATAALRCGSEIAAAWTIDSQRRLVERLVAQGAVDGVTKQCKAGVDGLALDAYLEPLADLRRLFLLPP